VCYKSIGGFRSRSAWRARTSAPNAAVVKDAALVEEFARHLEHGRRLSPHTVSAYLRDLRSLAEFLERGGSSLPDAGHPLLRRWLASLVTRGYARSSMARKTASIRTFYAWASRRGLVP